MKISVVMPVYNGGERMRRTIDSVLAQTWRDFEFLCIDDGSTDGVSGAILDEYASKDPRMVVLHRENRGVCETLNECHASAHGDFIARTDQDDVFHPQLLEYCAAAAERHNLDFLSFRYAKMDSGNCTEKIDVGGRVAGLSPWDAESRLSHPADYRNAIGSVHTDTWAHFMRRNLLVDYPIDPEWCHTRPFQRIHKARRWAATNEVLYFYDNMVSTSMSHQKFTMQDLKWDMDDLRHLCDFYDDERKAGDPVGEWEVVCRVYLIKCLKATLNKIRRSKGVMPESTRRALAQEFTMALREFFFRRGIPFRYASLRHQLSYLWLMFKYRNNPSEGGNV